jgi:hypothetical protein
MGPRCSSAGTQVCHRSYIIAARGLYTGMYVIGCWLLVAHSVFLIFYYAFKIQSEMTKRCKEAEC